MSPDPESAEPALAPSSAQALAHIQEAEAMWRGALRAHRLAPPDDGFAARLQALGEAAAGERAACEEGHSNGLRWRPVSDSADTQPPYELRPGTGRRGPLELWARFDAAVSTLNRATRGSELDAVAEGYTQVSEAALALADAVRREDKDARPRRRAG